MMPKYLAFLTIILLMAVLVGRELIFSATGDSLDLQEILANDQVTRQKWLAYQRFKAVLEATLDYLAAGDIPLKEACRRVHQAAKFDCPTYIRVLPRTDWGKTIQERIARNLLAHVRDQARIHPRFRSRVAALETELQELIVEWDKGQNLANPD
jgi:hypothetical protein